jgi:hypothetical protein
MRRLLWIFTLAPLLGIAIFYFIPPTTKHKPALKIHSGIQKKPAVLSQRNSQDAEELRYRKRREEMLKESMSRMSKLSIMTPRVQRLLIDKLIQDRKARYQALFESWNLEAAKADEVLTVVRERETLKYEALRLLYEDGVDGQRSFGETLSFGKESSDIQLSLLLGEARFQEFSHLEARMENEMQAEVKKLLLPD